MAAPRGAARVVRALRHRDFRHFFFGQLVSLVGTWMQSVAQAWLAYRLTGSAAWLGAVAFAGQIPAFLLAAWGGVAADRLPRRRILLATQTASMLLAFALAALTLAGGIGIAQLLALAALLGVINAFDIPARQAFVVEMVGRDDLVNAIALNSSAFNAARVVGPALAGVLVAQLGEGWCFLLNGASYLAVVGSLLRIEAGRTARGVAGGSALASLVEGFRYVAGARPVRALLLLLGLTSLAGMSYAVLMPVFADRLLGGGARTLGLLMGASGLGALAGALALATREGVRGLGRWAAFCAGGLGVALVAFSRSRSLALSALLLMPVGFFMMSQMAASNTLVQTLTPDRFRGRAMAAYTMMFMGMAPFGALVAGSVAERVGAPATVAGGGLLTVAGALVFASRLRPLTVEARQMIVALEALPGEPGAEVTSAREL